MRKWLLRKLFTHDEKYLIRKSIETQVDILLRIKVSEKWADKNQINEDVNACSELGKIFSTKDYA